MEYGKHAALARAVEQMGIEILGYDEYSLHLCAECGSLELEYYPPFQYDPYVSRRLEDLLADYGYYIEWYNPARADATLV